MHVFQPIASDIALNFFKILVDRVPGQVQAQRFTLTIQNRLFRPRLTAGIGLFNLLRLFCQHAKHIRLTNSFRF